MQSVRKLVFAIQTEHRQFAGLTSKPASWNWQKVTGKEVGFRYIRYESSLISYTEKGIISECTTVVLIQANQITLIKEMVKTDCSHILATFSSSINLCI